MGIPPRFFEAIRRNTFAATQLEDALMEVAVLLHVTSSAPVDPRNGVQEARRKYAGQPGTALIEAIRIHVTAHPNSLEVQELRELLDPAKAALEARHTLYTLHGSCSTSRNRQVLRLAVCDPFLSESEAKKTS
jgi:hypothetical protein